MVVHAEVKQFNIIRQMIGEKKEGGQQNCYFDFWSLCKRLFDKVPLEVVLKDRGVQEGLRFLKMENFKGQKCLCAER